ncbi:hypothetical protein CMK22_05730 [Candidatus Poribacteria bacterium]|nr:hypothetical protein [Candidatus Poribacteria bacterium]
MSVESQIATRNTLAGSVQIQALRLLLSYGYQLALEITCIFLVKMATSFFGSVLTLGMIYCKD